MHGTEYIILSERWLSKQKSLQTRLIDSGTHILEDKMDSYKLFSEFHMHTKEQVHTQNKWINK